MKFLIVVDCQRDFVDGALANPEAQARMPRIIHKIKETVDTNTHIIFTQDTHYENYKETLEGQKLPIPHCIVGTHGHEIVTEALEAAGNHYELVQKGTFGDIFLADGIAMRLNYDDSLIEEIEIIGFVSSICVISNALLLRANFPDTPIKIDASCCAGLTKEDHDAAMMVAQNCQIDVVNWER